jgi:hypothetical protein
MLSAVSVHESSHAVCAERLGLSTVTITAVAKPSRGYGGFAQFDKQQVPADASNLTKCRIRLRSEGILTLAGPIGEHEHTHEPLSRILRRCVGDRRAARRCATAFALSLPRWDANVRYQIFDDWLTETHTLVRENWHIITVLAGKLALNGTLGAADVARIIELADRKAA